MVVVICQRLKGIYGMETTFISSTSWCFKNLFKQVECVTMIISSFYRTTKEESFLFGLGPLRYILFILNSVKTSDIMQLRKIVYSQGKIVIRLHLQYDFELHGEKPGAHFLQCVCHVCDTSM